MKTTMKTIFTTLGALLLAVTFSNAQPGKGEHPRELPNAEKVEKMVNLLSHELSLTAEQKTDIGALYVAHFKKLRKDHTKKELDRLAHKKQRDDFFALVKTELNEAQIVKFDEFNEKHHEKRKGKGNDHRRK